MDKKGLLCYVWRGGSKGVGVWPRVMSLVLFEGMCGVAWDQRFTCVASGVPRHKASLPTSEVGKVEVPHSYMSQPRRGSTLPGAQRPCSKVRDMECLLPLFLKQACSASILQERTLGTA